LADSQAEQKPQGIRIGNLMVSPEAIELFWLSVISLFFELLVIRWLGCGFFCFSVFKSFPLVTCFVGLGVGIAKGDDKYFGYTPIALFVFAAITQAMNFSGIGSISFPSLGLYQWTAFEAIKWGFIAQIVLYMTLAMLLLLAGPFAFMFSLGTRIGKLFNAQKPLTAYCFDIGGALLGSVIFALSSFQFLSPAAQLTIVAAALLYFAWKRFRPWIPPAIALIAAACIAFVPTTKGSEISWTPYSRIEKTNIDIAGSDLGQKDMEHFGFQLAVNQNFQQGFTKSYDLNLTKEAIKREPYYTHLLHRLFVRKNYYSVPYLLTQPKDMLVLGAGVGSDVKEAVKHNLDSVDAVEIDPGIVKLGRANNPAYSLPNVRVFCDDARNYINLCQKKYDLIVFGCLDSYALSGVGSSIKTDAYIHTKESYAKCLSLLKPNGVLIITFGAPTSGSTMWLRDRIYKTITAAAGYPPMLLTDDDKDPSWPAYIFVSGEPVRSGILKPISLDKSFHGTTVTSVSDERTLTDDWPFLYVKKLLVDVPYISVVLVIILITTIVGRGLVFGQKSASDCQLFFLGSAFILLELQAISRLSLLYGSTWLTSLIVINGVLLMILGANFFVLKFRAAEFGYASYFLLFATLLGSYFLPITEMLKWDFWTGHLTITFLTLLPIFLAGLVFANCFKQVKTPARSFAFNLLGSVLGALMEYFADYWGVSSLILIASILYLFSFLFFVIRRSNDSKQSSLPA
jgi:Spermine/spermidine synthase domain